MSRAGPRFVEVPADRLLAQLRDIGSKVAGAGGRFVEGQQGREVVVDVVPPGGKAMVRVFTSLAQGAEVARECGEDAVRVVVGVELAGGFRPLEEGEKILRTAPQKEKDRPGVFLARLRERIGEAYKRARSTPTCEKCGRVMAKRRQKTPPGREFYGCLGFPECKHTKPI